MVAKMGEERPSQKKGTRWVRQLKVSLSQILAGPYWPRGTINRLTTAMNTILQATSDLLKSRKMQPAFTEDGNMLLVNCSGEHHFWTTIVDTSDDNTIITLLSRVPVKVPVAKRAACAKLVARFNYGKRHGAFHLDVRDGEVLFCISNVLTAGIAPEETLDALFGSTYCAMNEHAPEIIKLVYGRSPAPDSEAAAPSPSRNRSLNPPDLTN
jgi:hypothetical protein